MKPLVRLFLLLTVVLALGSDTQAAEKRASSSLPGPGVEAAKTLSTITGVAISPLMGVGAVGAYEWWQAPKEKRTHLHWYAQPYFWLPALLLVGLIAAKDILGTAAPTALKKPFDVAEAVENKVSGLVAAGAFVPFMVSIFPAAADPAGAALGDAGFAAISLGQVGNWLMVPFAIALFLIVWLAAHAINILILLSPFTSVDTALKSLRTSVLGLLVLTSFINPWLGALLSVAVVIFAWLIAGWSFRLLVLGQVYCWDFFTFRRHRFQPVANGNWMFAARAIGEMPIRSYGKLFSTLAGNLAFEYRPWLVLPKKVLELPPTKHAVGRGLFCPEVMRVDGDDTRTIFLLPPRYKGHEADLAKACGLTDIRDVGLLKGFKAVGRALKSLVGMGSKQALAVASA